MDSFLDVLIAVVLVSVALSAVDWIRSSRIHRTLAADTASAMNLAETSQRAAEAHAQEMTALAEAHQQRLYQLLAEQNSLLQQILAELRSNKPGA